MAAIVKPSKKRGKGHFDVETGTGTGKYICTLARMSSSRCLVQLKDKQVSSEPLPFHIGCTVRKYFHAKISAVHVSVSYAKFIY